MAITDAEAARQMAEQYPDLHESRQIAFGQNYLQDLEQGKGTAQYYTGFGLAPDWVTGAIGDPYKAPVVQEPTAGDAQVAEQIAAGDREAGITGASIVQPTSDPFLASGAAGGARLPPMDQAGAVAAMTPDAAYSLPGESDPFLASGAAGGARLPATQATTTLPSGDVFATDDPMLQEKMDYTEKTPAWWESARDKFVTTGQDVGGIFKDLAAKGIDVGQIAIGSLMNMIAPGLGLITQITPKDTSEDTWNRQFALGGEGYDELIASDPELGKRLEGYAGDLIAGTGEGKDPFGRNTVSMFGDYEARLAEDLQYRGDNQFNKDKQAYAQAYFDKKGIADNPNEAKAFEEKYGISPTGAPVTRDRLIDEGIAAADQEDDMLEPEIIPEKKPKVETFAEKAEKAWQNIETINTPGGTIYGNEQIGFFPSPGEAQAALEAYAAEADQAEAGTETAVTGVEGPPSEIYRDPIMEMAAEQAAKENALQEELEAYRDPIRDMVDPTGEINVEDLTKDEGPFSITAADALSDQTGTIDEVPDIYDTGEPTLGGTIEAQNMDEIIQQAEYEAAARAREEAAIRDRLEAAQRAEDEKRARAREAAAANQGGGNGGNQGGGQSAAGAGGGSQQAKSGGSSPSGGWGGGWGWSKGGIVGLKNAKR